MGKGGRTVLDKETKTKEKNPIYIMSEPTLYHGQKKKRVYNILWTIKTFKYELYIRQYYRNIVVTQEKFIYFFRN